MKRLFKYALYLILFALTLLTAFIAYLYFSEEKLDPQIQQLVKNAQTNQDVYSPENGFIYLFGMDAPEGTEDVYAFGLDKIKRLKANPKEDVTPAQRLTFDTQPCKAYAQLADCLIGHYLAHPDKTQQVLNTHHTLLMRYRAYLNKPEYRNLLTQSTLTLPPFQYVMYGRQLSAFYALNLMQNGEHSKGVNILLHDIEDARAKLQQADNLIHKMVGVAHISRQLDALSVLNQARAPLHPITQYPSDTLGNLTPQEINYTPFLMGEFLYTYHSVADMASYSEINWAQRTVLKLFTGPNVFFNHHFKGFKRIATLPTHPKQYLLARNQLLAQSDPMPFRTEIAFLLTIQEDTEQLLITYTDRLMTLNNKLQLLRISLSHPNITDDVLAQFPSEIDGSLAHIEHDAELPESLTRLCYPDFAQDARTRLIDRCLIIPKAQVRDLLATESSS